MATTDRRKILVVDDDRLTLAMLSDILSGQFDITTAEHGDGAIEALRHNDFVAVLSDHMMPGMTGVEVLAKCQTMQPEAARILVTASENIEDVRDAVNVARVHRAVIKPIREVEIDAAVGPAKLSGSDETERFGSMPDRFVSIS